MSKLVEEAINEIRALPEGEQEAVAALILKEFDGKKKGSGFRHLRNGPSGMIRRISHPEPLEILKRADWKATPENADQICDYIAELIESSYVPEARRIVSAIPPGVSVELDYWKKVLAEPVARITKSATDRDPKKDMLWIEKNADRYRGKWVALKSGELLGSYESLKELHHTLKKSGRLAGTLAFRVGD